MTSVAFFTAPKPFTNAHIRIIQRNAIQSWKSLGKQVEVWLVGDEPGVEQNARELKVGYIPEVARNSFGTPRIDSIFHLVREQSQAEYLCYVNADILVFPDMLRALEEVRARRSFPHHRQALGRRGDRNTRHKRRLASTVPGCRAGNRKTAPRRG